MSHTEKVKYNMCNAGILRVGVRTRLLLKTWSPEYESITNNLNFNDPIFDQIRPAVTDRPLTGVKHVVPLGIEPK